MELMSSSDRDSSLTLTCKRLGVTDQELSALRLIFTKFDTNGDETLDASELPALLASLTPASTWDGSYSADEVALIQRTIDTDGSGVVDFAEFVHWWAGGADAADDEPPHGGASSESSSDAGGRTEASSFDGSSDSGRATPDAEEEDEDDDERDDDERDDDERSDDSAEAQFDSAQADRKSVV